MHVIYYGEEFGTCVTKKNIFFGNFISKTRLSDMLLHFYVQI